MSNADENIIFDFIDIFEAITNTAGEINHSVFESHDQTKPPVYICIMDGAVQFFTTITGMLPSGYCVYMKASSYRDGQQAGELTISDVPKGLDADDIFIFDDICDTGATLKCVKEAVQKTYPNANVHTAVLINRDVSEEKYTPDFITINTTNPAFFAGYGMDDKGNGRNLPFIYDCTRRN